MGVTPTYGFPYPALTDSPNGPAQIQALAEAVEADLVVTDANITNLVATGLTYMKFLGGTQRSSDTAAITAETVVSTSGAISLPASSLILVRGRIDYFTTTSDMELFVKFRTTNIAGAIERQIITDRNDGTAAVPKAHEWSLTYKTTSSETHTWVSTVARFSGTGTVTCQGGTSVMVYYLGASTLLSTSNP